VVVGGLVVSTLLTLFILPTYYFAMERFFASRAWGIRSRRDR
jgi:cobalt-zinc-cadmium resistance protein CzcA